MLRSLSAVLFLLCAPSAFATNLDEGELTYVNAFRVVSADGSLNCRSRPSSDGAVLRVYSTGDILEGSRSPGFPRMGYDANGNPWVGTSDGCYVRADDRYIVPASPADMGSPYDANGEVTPEFGRANFEWQIITNEDSDDRRGHGGPRGLNCRAQPDASSPVVMVYRQGESATAGDWAQDSRGKAWVLAINPRTPCWLRATSDRLLILNYGG